MDETGNVVKSKRILAEEGNEDGRRGVGRDPHADQLICLGSVFGSDAEALWGALPLILYSADRVQSLLNVVGSILDHIPAPRVVHLAFL